MAEPTANQWFITTAIGVGSFVLGQLLPRFWMSKKEQKDVEQANYLNSAKLIDEHQAVYRSYCDALIAYRAEGGATADQFVKVATAGDDYFRKAKFTCDAIMSDKIDRQHRDNTLVPHFKRIVETTLPDHYAFMSRESKNHGYDYRGELRREDHQSIYIVVEKFGRVT